MQSLKNTRENIYLFVSVVTITLSSFLSCGENEQKWKQGLSFPEIDNVYPFLSTNLSEPETSALTTDGEFDVLNKLREDLVTHKELIPYSGVLGGTMEFYSKEKIKILSGGLVLAPFEDGHIGANLLLAYRIKGGKINWQVICVVKN